MGETPVPLKIELELANVDRGVTEQIVIQTARHPSEKMERVWLRVLAFAWQWRPGMLLGGSVSDPDEADMSAADETGRTIALVFVGKPDLYHALQACLIPLYPVTGSLTHGIIEQDHPKRL